MKTRLIVFCLSVLAISLNPALAQEKEKKDAYMGHAAAEMDAMMKKWMEAATPGENHKVLDSLVGSWETATSIWMEGPDKPPSVTMGSAEITWVLDGRFIMQETKGEMMGKPFSGIGMTGYDNMNKKYISFWVDNSATAMFTSEGSLDKNGNTLTLFGKMDEPMTGEHDKNVKYVTRIVDKNKHIFEIHDLAIGEPNTRVVEVTYTRKK